MVKLMIGIQEFYPYRLQGLIGPNPSSTSLSTAWQQLQKWEGVREYSIEINYMIIWTSDGQNKNALIGLPTLGPARMLLED